MAKTPVRDSVIWAKHIHGDDSVVAYLQSLRGGDTVDLIVDGVLGVWRKMADGKNGRQTSGIRPVGSAQDFWKQLYESRRGDVVDLEIGQSERSSNLPAAPSIIERAPGSPEDRMAALERFFELGRMGYGSEGRTMTRDEMHER